MANDLSSAVTGFLSGQGQAALEGCDPSDAGDLAISLLTAIALNGESYGMHLIPWSILPKAIRDDIHHDGRFLIALLHDRGEVGAMLYAKDGLILQKRLSADNANIHAIATQVATMVGQLNGHPGKDVFQHQLSGVLLRYFERCC